MASLNTLFLSFILYFFLFDLQIKAIARIQNPRITRSNSSENFIDPFMGELEAGQKKHYASWDTAAGQWHGARAKINLWGIDNVQPHSHSGAYFTAYNYDNRKESIATGVHVFPSLYGDNDLHFFTYWTQDDYTSTGCYNTKCPGFVVANGSNLVPGIEPVPVSVYGGEGYFITLRIKKDEQTGDWSLYREDKGGPIGGMTLLGWWPKDLFTGLADHATKIQFSGAVVYDQSETSPPMGSGHVPDEGEGKAAYFKNLLAFDNGGNDYDLENKDVNSFEDADECYNVSDWMECKHDGHYFYYGGPSGCKD